MARSQSDAPTYVDSPTGIVTVAGTRFRTTEKLLREFAEPVFDREPLGSLIRQAEVWAQSPVTMALWALPVLLLLLPIWVATVAALALFAVWRVISPAAPVRAGIAVLSILQKPMLQGIYFVVALTLLGWASQTPAVLVGLAGFIGLRFGLVEMLLKPILDPLLARMYPLPVPDQVLRAVIVRAALRHDIPLPELSRLEESAREAWKIHGKN